MNILITGGASGLGEAITKTLAREVYNKVYFTYSKSAENAHKIEAEFNNTVSIKCDFKDHADVTALANSITDFDIDILINSAYNGSFLKAHFNKIAPSDFTDEFVTNIIPTIIITQSAIALFRKKKTGKIITILTAALANVPPIGSAIYSANKAYLEKLTKVWANENIKFNITSNSVSPSFMLTNMTADTDERMVEQIISSHPLKKLLTVEEVAESVLFLSKASNHINGIDVLINAGNNLK